MIGAALVDPIIALVRNAAPDLRYVGPANDLAALIAARRLPERVPAAYVLPTAEAAEQTQRTVHRTLVTTIMTVVLVTSESRRGPDDRRSTRWARPSSPPWTASCRRRTGRCLGIAAATSRSGPPAATAMAACS
ncbi:hypothetical protein F1188_19945 [Roseospira marina]|uniref:Uncharacterized protein n=1 Tax=Roseospira marina TaxID=140057 RepID=A0A5M6I4S0_9PROT|nr:hypothetical protein [Roseospira marina]KAA5603220.1 hypothetical protein F1188_19945 [Roseospira marina]MBB4316206.1 hypothetical protein [Roseospira marina]MBB5089404.1 hypothetical protein [Roseospira marina]